MTNKYGKETQAPRKIGLAPISSDGVEYEFTTVFDLDRSTHLAVATKDRTGLFAGRNMHLTFQIGRELKSWRDGGASVANPVQQPPPEPTPQNDAVAPLPKPARTRAKKADKSISDEFVAIVTITDEQLNRLEALVGNYRVDAHALADYLSEKNYLDRQNPNRPLQFISEAGYYKMLEIFSNQQRAVTFANYISSTYSSAVKTA